MKTLPTTIITLTTLAGWSANEPLHLEANPALQAQQLIEAIQMAQAAPQAVQADAFEIRRGAGGGGARLKVRPTPRQIRSLVVSPQTTDPKVIAQIEEDLAVMSRLLNKEVEKEVGADANKAMGISISSWSSDTKAPEAMYLDGFGALFTLNVNFPLLPASDEKTEKKTAPPPESEWDKARQEVFGGGGEPNDPMQHARVLMPQQPMPEYDPDKVDALKRTILSTLRNSVNIRALKPDDSVSVAVLSYPNRFGGNNAFVSGHVSVVVTGDGQTMTKTFDSSTDSARHSTLTMRVKKSDLDSFAQGKLTLDELKKKASITVY